MSAGAGGGNSFTYSSVTGSTACQICANGSMPIQQSVISIPGGGTDAAGIGCTVCPAGQSSSYGAQCQSCQGGTFSTSSGSSSCRLRLRLSVVSNRLHLERCLQQHLVCLVRPRHLCAAQLAESVQHVSSQSQRASAFVLSWRCHCVPVLSAWLGSRFRASDSEFKHCQWWRWPNSCRHSSLYQLHYLPARSIFKSWSPRRI